MSTFLIWKDILRVVISLSSNEIPFLELKIEHNVPYELTVKDVIVSLFGVYPNVQIETRTMLYKELFLIFEEVLKSDNLYDLGKNIDPKFVQYIYGPFSFLIASELGSLVYNNTIEKDGRKKDEKFSLTEKGVYMLEMLRKRLIHNHLFEEFLSELSKLRKGWEKLGVQGMMNRMKRLYPNYFLFGVKDYIKKRKMAIELIKGDEMSKEKCYNINYPLSDSLFTPENEIILMAKTYSDIEKQNGGFIWAKSYKE